MTVVLGISAYYHDSAAALVVDGELVAAAQEERFTRNKHDAAFPIEATQFCLDQAGLSGDKIDYVGFYEKPLLKFDRLLETYLSYAPRGFRSFTRAMPQWLKQKLMLTRDMRQALGGHYKRRFVFCEHHESHAASAFYPSPFQQAAIITLDGVGEWATGTWGVGSDNRIELKQEMRFPHSLGLLYSAFTYFVGFRVNSGEYKLMGLAPYGRPVYADLIFDQLLDLKEDGSFRLNMSYFDYGHRLRMTGRKLERLLGRPRREPESPLTQDDMDLAASIQFVTEEIMLRTARYVHRRTGEKNVCLAGGVALNCVGIGRIMREGPFERVWVQPASGDAGGAVGIAKLIWHQLLDQPRYAKQPDGQAASLLGPQIDGDQPIRELQQAGAVFHHITDEANLLERVSDLLASGNVVGWAQGRMEFGPRALGCRSILGDPRNPEMQAVMNQKIKYRESFRPFAPSVMREHVGELFQVPNELDAPYMTVVAGVREELRQDVPQSPELRERIMETRSTIPAITHVDYSSRLQTVDAQRHGRYHRLLHAFYTKTGCPVLINTSFNVRGEPIVCSPSDAYRCFLATEMDVLVVGDLLLLKEEQPRLEKAEVARHLSHYPLD